MKNILLIVFYCILYSSCCEKDVYLPPDPVDEVVGIYKAEQFAGIIDYKIKVIKISADTIKITPFIGSEMYSYNAVYEREVSGTKVFKAIEYNVWFNVNKDPITIHSFKPPEYEGWKIE